MKDVTDELPEPAALAGEASDDYEAGREAALDWVREHGVAPLRRVGEARRLADVIEVLDDVPSAPDDPDPDGDWARGFFEGVEEVWSDVEGGL